MTPQNFRESLLACFEDFRQSLGQCWHWFDRPKAAREVRGLLVPNGWLVIAHFDWIPLPGNVVEATEQLIEQHNPEWTMSGGRGLYSRWLSDVAIAGFYDIETFSFDIFVPYSHERIDMGVVHQIKNTKGSRGTATI
jgi:SAM-dependent methyltransferase